MGADVDLNNVDVATELKNWGKWYVDTTNIDGFRLDAVKHIRSSFYLDWITDIEERTGKNFFSVGEYWSTNVATLNQYIQDTKEKFALFDVPLHYNFFNASNSNGHYDMRTIFDNTLVKSNPEKAVTFVDNHDTQPGQSLCSWVQDWFKPLAYAIILLRKQGLPCVFYGDFYGIPHDHIPSRSDLLIKLLRARKLFAYGNQIDYFNDPNIIAWVLEGDYEHPDSGMVVILSDGNGGAKQMNVGKRLANCVLCDYTGHIAEPVYVDSEGNGIFYVNGGSVSVWVKRENMYDET